MSGEKRPSWFKLKKERLALLRQLPPEAAVNVLCGCLEYLDTRTAPADLTAIEEIAFSVFLPDVEEAWRQYEQRVTAKIGRYRSMSVETEEETDPEVDTEPEEEKRGRGRKPTAAEPPPARADFLKSDIPTLEAVKEYAIANGIKTNVEKFFQYYDTRLWKINGQPMSWRSALKSWKDRDEIFGTASDEWAKADIPSKPRPKKWRTIERDGELVDVPDD